HMKLVRQIAEFVAVMKDNCTRIRADSTDLPGAAWPQPMISPQRRGGGARIPGSARFQRAPAIQRPLHARQRRAVAGKLGKEFFPGDSFDFGLTKYTD